MMVAQMDVDLVDRRGICTTHVRYSAPPSGSRAPNRRASLMPCGSRGRPRAAAPLSVSLMSVSGGTSEKCLGTATITSFAGVGVTSSTVNAVTCLSSRSEEHTSELQSRENLVCRLLLETKKKICSADDS